MPSKIKSIFLYPLHLESLGTLIFVIVFAYVLAAAAILSFEVSQGAPLYLFGTFTLLILVAIYFEYGLEIIDGSSNGQTSPPPLSIAMIRRGRFSRQVLMLLFFGGLVIGAFTRNLDYLGVLAICFVSLVFPASLALNSLCEDLLELVNPVTLLGFIVITGRDYVSASLAFALLIYVFTTMAIAGIVDFLLFLPFGLYAGLVFFRFLGLTIYRHRAALLPEKEFGEKEKQINRFYDDNEKMQEVLKSAYLKTKNDSVDEAIAQISPIIQLGEWARFELAFEIISGWPNKQPGLHFAKAYIPRLLEKSNAMRALGLCEWSLKHNTTFYITDEAVLEQLVAASASQQQFVVSVKLLENFVVNCPGHVSGLRYLSMAADICQTRLHHQKKFEELTGKLKNLQPRETDS